MAWDGPFTQLYTNHIIDPTSQISIVCNQHHTLRKRVRKVDKSDKRRIKGDLNVESVGTAWSHLLCENRTIAACFRLHFLDRECAIFVPSTQSYSKVTHFLQLPFMGYFLEYVLLSVTTKVLLSIPKWLDKPWPNTPLSFCYVITRHLKNLCSFFSARGQFASSLRQLSITFS